MPITGPAVLQHQPLPPPSQPKANGWGKPPRVRNPERRFSATLTQARKIQELAFQVSMALQQDLISAPDADSRKQVAVALRQAVSAWETAVERVRIARGQPMPGSLKPIAQKPKPKHRPTNSQWTEQPSEAPSKESDAKATD